MKFGLVVCRLYFGLRVFKDSSSVGQPVSDRMFVIGKNVDYLVIV
jgi:hypothetical protein